MLTAQTNITTQKHEPIDHGFIDNKGRSTGVRVSRYECDLVAASENEPGDSELEPGHYFGVCVQDTLNGDGCGEAKLKFFTTTEERDTFIALRVKQSKSRASKNGVDVSIPPAA